MRDDPLGLELARMAHDLGWNAARAKIMQHLLDANIDPIVIREVGDMAPEPSPAIEMTQAVWDNAMAPKQ